MNYVQYIKTALLFIVVISCIGCKSKQEAPVANSTPQLPMAKEIKTISGENAGGNLTTSPQDKTEVQAAASRILTQFIAGEYATIYNGASPGFKKIGTEVDFVNKFQQKRQNIGILKNLKETNIVTRPDNAHVLIFRLENESYKTDLRLTFTRTQSGKMELAGLNQHDELKK